jgi:hypothetical protein
MDKGSVVQGQGEHRAILGTLDQIGLSYSGKEARVSVRDIMGTAGSSRQSTFETFYHKPAISDYPEAVLGGKDGSFKQYTVIYLPCHVVELKISQGSLDLM